MLPDAAIRGLLLLLLLFRGVSAGTVLPPTNLTVSCDNLKVMARWHYSQQQPNTRFRVKFFSDSDWDGEKNTTDHHVDLSQFLWKSEQRYMAVHYVSVIAMLEENQSNPVQSKIFTFNELRPSHLKCKLNFPPVNLKVDDSKFTVNFTNPFYFYKELLQAAGKEAAYFKFNVATADKKNVTATCPVGKENCQSEINVNLENIDNCVTLTGWLFDGNGIRYIVFNETSPICPDTTTDPYMILLIVLLFVTSMVVITITVSICLTKSWTMKKEEPSMPSALGPHNGIRKPYFTVPEEECNTAMLTGKPKKSQSVSSEEDDNLQGSKDGSVVHDSNYREGGLLENSCQLLELGCSRSDDDSADDSVKTEIFTMNMEEEKEEDEETKEEERSAYDSPQNLQLNTDKGYQKR